MPKKTYTAEEKENALRLCDEIGAKKASEQTGIFINTLYNWRRAKAEAIAPAAAEVEVPVVAPAASKKRIDPSRKQAISVQISAKESCTNELVRLQIENDTLKAQIAAMKSALRAYTE